MSEDLKRGIINTISTQVANIINSNLDYYGRYDIVISDEQQFYKTDIRNPDRIYVVVKFLDASINFKQIVQPININIVSEHNKLEVANKLFFEYAMTYNLAKSEDNRTTQVYTTPYVLSTFEEVFEGYRSILYVSGTFLIAENANFFSLYYSPIETQTRDIENINLFTLIDEEEQEIQNATVDLQKFKKKVGDDFLFDRDYVFTKNQNGGWLLDGQNISSLLGDYGIKFNQPFDGDNVIVRYTFGWREINALVVSSVSDFAADTQPFYNSNNFTESIVKFGTRTINITSYLFDNEIFSKCLRIYLGMDDVNNDFNLYLKYDIGDFYKISNYKMVSFSQQQNVGELLTVSITFTE